MKMLLALRDVRTGAFLAPVVVTTPGEAERWYMEVLAQEGTMIQKYPRDFPLYEIGKYDEFEGVVYPLVNEAGVHQVPRLFLDASMLAPREVKEAK